jgi:hypothetical protein
VYSFQYTFVSTPPGTRGTAAKERAFPGSVPLTVLPGLPGYLFSCVFGGECVTPVNTSGLPALPVAVTDADLTATVPLPFTALTALVADMTLMSFRPAAFTERFSA